MKRLIAVLFAAVLVTLVVTSIASARTGHKTAPGTVKLGLRHHVLAL